jgi:hypothetical protein
MKTCDRRTFLATTALAGAFQIVPRHVLGRGYVAPSDKVTLAYIGLGTQGLRELPRLLENTDVQIVAVCDPNPESTDYLDWSRDGIRSSLARFLEQPSWREGVNGIPGGREVGRDVIQRHYGWTQTSGTSSGCASYADFRELLEKERDVDAVKIMTPDHLHATIAVAAMRKGKHVMMHKPLANRISESRLVIETARKTGVVTHFIPWDTNGSMEYIKQWVDEGVIGTLREIHNWTNRPVWPQYDAIPTDTPPVPSGFDWDLWLGPEQYRPYHPKYTHMVFRGWYDFGGGSMADMGHYSLWSVLKALDLGPPVSADPILSHACAVTDGVSRPVRNHYSFPAACTVKFRFNRPGSQTPLDLFWYDGGMRPQTPEELEIDGRTLPAEGFLFVGDKGKIISGFRLADPRLIPDKRWTEFTGPKPPPPPAPDSSRAPESAAPTQSGATGPPAIAGSASTTGGASGGRGDGAPPSRAGSPAAARGVAAFVAACRGGEQPASSFLHAGPVSETLNLGAVALRVGSKVMYDSATIEITNNADANRYLTREYRKGWELT